MHIFITINPAKVWRLLVKKIRHGAYPLLVTGFFLLVCGSPYPVAANDFEIISSEAPEPGIRTWRALSGSTVEANFVRLEGQNVILARQDGVEFRIPASKLSAGDITYLKARVLIPADHGNPPVPPPPIPPSDADRETPAAGGSTQNELEGAYGMYEHPTFDAITDSSGAVTIYLKDRGERIAKPIKLLARITYRNPYRASKVIELSPPEDLVRQPKMITLQGKTVDHKKTRQEVTYEVSYSFEGNQVSAWGRSLADGTHKEPETLEIVAKIPSTHDIPPSTEQPERIKILKDYFLEVKGGDGGNQSYNYYTSPNFARKTHNSANLIGPLWEPREVTFSRSSKKAPLRPYIYSGKLLWEGFVLFVVKPDPRADEPSHKMVITIE